MRVFTVTSGSDDPDTGLTLREAVGQAARSKADSLIVFAEDVQVVTLDDAIAIGRGAKITIDGDKDGDGILDVFIGADRDANTHHFEVAAGARVTIKDVLLYDGASFQGTGAAGENGGGFPGRAADGAHGTQLEVPDGSDTATVRAEAEKLDGIILDGADGADGADGRDGGAGENGADAAGSIVNAGDLTLVRVNFYNNSAIGGDGGRGGAGQDGQDGGGGGNGAVGAVRNFTSVFSDPYDTRFGARDGGDGGDAGAGGDGGDGGAGGKGGDAAAAILNRDTGTLTMVDVALGGRMSYGLLTDRFGMEAFGGAGGQGGDGGDGGDAGSAGFGADDVYSVPEGDATFTGEIFDLLWRRFEGGTSNAVWSGRYDGFEPGNEFQNRVFTEEAFADGRFRASTESGTGGNGADGGQGGDAGGNGRGGNAAVIVNYGTITGTGAFGTANEATAGAGDPSDFLDLIGTPGLGGRGSDGQTGGAQKTEYFWTVRPYQFVLGEFERWDFFTPAVGPESGTASGRDYLSAVDLPDDYFPQDPAPGGSDGANGLGGRIGGVGAAGEGSTDLVSEGISRGFTADAGLVYLAGVRQDAAFGQLLFNVIRIGDTAEDVTVTYTIRGIGKGKVTRADFDDPDALTGTITFRAIDQTTGPALDSAGAGIARIALDLAAGGGLEGAERFRIVLKSDDVTLGTSVYTGTLFDGDYARVDGTAGNDRALDGGGGADAMFGQTGDDRLDGKAGDDVLFGGADNDTLTGGAGNDRLEGGDGADRFVFAGRTGNDTVADFADGDRVDLSGYDIAFRDLGFAASRAGVTVTHEGGTILFEGLARADLAAGDFLFG